MTMTLEQVRDKLRRYAKDADTYFNRTRETLELTSAVLLADAIDAHLAQPAQSVDVAAKDAEIDRLTRGNIGYAQDNVNLIGREHIALKRAESAESRLAAANAQLRLMHRVLSQAVCVACADDGGAKDHELDKLEGVLRDQGWITSAVVPSAPIDTHLQGSGDEA